MKTVLRPGPRPGSRSTSGDPPRSGCWRGVGAILGDLAGRGEIRPSMPTPQSQDSPGHRLSLFWPDGDGLVPEARQVPEGAEVFSCGSCRGGAGLSSSSDWDGCPEQIPVSADRQTSRAASAPCEGTGLQAGGTQEPWEKWATRATRPGIEGQLGVFFRPRACAFLPRVRLTSIISATGLLAYHRPTFNGFNTLSSALQFSD